MKKIILMIIVGSLLMGCIDLPFLDNNTNDTNDDTINTTNEQNNTQNEPAQNSSQTNNTNNTQDINNTQNNNQTNEINNTETDNNLEYTYTPDAPLEIYILNVGYASASLLVKGDFHMLIDAGDPTGGGKIISKLDELNVDDIDVLMITHPVNKRVSGASRIVDYYDIEEVWDIGVVSEYYEEAKNKMIEKGIPSKTIEAGQKYTYNGIDFEFYNPTGTFSYDNEKLNSIVFKVSDRNFNMLFTSDVETIEFRNIGNDHPNLYASIVEVPNNGKSSIRDLNPNNQAIIKIMDQTQPDYLIMSVGPNNDNSPSPQLITAIETREIPYYRTDEDGTLLISFDNNAYEIYTNK